MNSSCCLLVHQILLFIRLDRDHVLSHFMLGTSHYRKGALAYLETYLKVLQIEWLLIWLALPLGINHCSESFEPTHGALVDLFLCFLFPLCIKCNRFFFFHLRFRYLFLAFRWTYIYILFDEVLLG